jgi:hypothetical protein
MTTSMRNHWAVRAIACALIATLPALLPAQTPAPASTAAEAALSDIELAPWGPYARLVGQTMKDVDPSGYRLRWRWETPGQVLLEEWFGGTGELDKPAAVMTIRLGPQPRTLNLKSSSMMGKEWVGTLQADGSIDYVGKGMLKMPYSIRIDEKGDYVQTATKGRTYRYAAITNSETPAIAEAPATPASSPDPAVATAPTAPVASEAPAPVLAKQATLPPPAPVKAPRKLSQADLARIQQSVQKSRARSIEQARQAELQRQDVARQAQLQAQLWAAQEAQRQAEEAEADAEFEAERARKAAAWQQQTQANEQALADSMQRLRDTTARAQAQQADALARQRAQADAQAAAERQRQAELIRQANQRQEAEAARLAAQRQQYEQQRADAQAAERARQQQSSAGHASTDTDANRCVTQTEVRQNDTFQGNTAAYVVNGCGAPVDVRMCLMTDSGWKCGATWGLAPQARWSHSAFRATGPVFVDARTAGSNRRLASPN